MEGSSLDDTSVNAIKLYCKNPDTNDASTNAPTSSIGEWGEWEGLVDCSSVNYWIVGFQMFAEPDTDATDESGTNNLRVKCRGPGLSGTNEESVMGVGYDHDGQWGSWSSDCPSGTAVCGIVTKVEPEQPSFTDDTALTDLKLYCCKY